ncbi:hypothetical protein [uncultured Muribaculum sp.]|nr:hypothetical protein [uncultured Muribaculum sp.]
MNSFLRALGFRSHDEDLDDLSDCPSALPIQQPSRTASTEQSSGSDNTNDCSEGSCDKDVSSDVCNQQVVENDSEDSATAFPLTIFDSLLEVFNEAQPEFIRKCLDVDAQRRYLYDCVDASFRDYIGRIREDALRRAYSDRDAEHRRMTLEIDNLRAQIKEKGKTSDDLKALKASADRQKRTFNERIRDLEQQLAAAMADKEQYDLEVKSLMNKIKVQQLQQSDVQELEELRTRLAEANKQITAMNAANAMRESTDEAYRRESEKLRARIDELTAQLDSVKKEAADTVCDGDERMGEITRLTNRLAEAEATMKAAEERLVAAEKHSRELQSRLDEAESRLAEVSDVSVVSDAPFPAVETGAPSSVQENNPQEADVAKAVVADVPKKRRGRPKRSVPRISAIDESMDSTQWLVATPPEGANLKVTSPSDSDFGYQEPPRKPQPPENDAQMLLF